MIQLPAVPSDDVEHEERTMRFIEYAMAVVAIATAVVLAFAR